MRHVAARGQRGPFVGPDGGQQRRPNAERRARQHVDGPIADHPRGGDVIPGVANEGFRQQPRCRLAAQTGLLRPVVTDVRAENDSPARLRLPQHRRVHGLEVGAGRLAFGRRGLVAGDDDSETGLGQIAERVRRPWARRLLLVAPVLGLMALFSITGIRGVDFGDHWDEVDWQIQPVRDMVNTGLLLPRASLYPSFGKWLTLLPAIPPALRAALKRGSSARDIQTAMIATVNRPNYLLTVRCVYILFSALLPRLR